MQYLTRYRDCLPQSERETLGDYCFDVTRIWAFDEDLNIDPVQWFEENQPDMLQWLRTHCHGEWFPHVLKESFRSQRDLYCFCCITMVVRNSGDALRFRLRWGVELLPK